MQVKKIKVSSTSELDYLGRVVSSWKKFEILEAEVGENESPEDAFDKAVLVLENVEKKHLPEVVEPAMATQRKLQPDKAIREKFAKAVAAQDLPTVSYLETIYQF